MIIMPPGFKFKPSNQELLNHYLYQKTYGRLPVESNEQDGLAIPDHFIIPDVYIYDYDPGELQEFFKVHSAAQLDTGECYFFCPRRYKYRKGHEENRATKSGYWKLRGKKQVVRTSNITAEKIGLTFYLGRQGTGIVTKYKMHLYRPISNNIYPNVTPQEASTLTQLFPRCLLDYQLQMPHDLCYIFVKETKPDRGDNAPLCNGSDSNTTMNSSAHDSNIYTSHQQDQTAMYYVGNEIYPNYVDREFEIPSTTYAFASSSNSQIPSDHQLDQAMEFEEIYSLLPQPDDSINEIYPPSAYT